MKWHIIIISLFISYPSYSDDLSDELEFILNILDKEEVRIIEEAKKRPIVVLETQKEDENPLGLDEISIIQSSTDDFVDLEKE